MLVNPPKNDVLLISTWLLFLRHSLLRNADLKSYFGDLHTSMHTFFRSVSGCWDHRKPWDPTVVSLRSWP